jgi:hypothetical protein
MRAGEQRYGKSANASGEAVYGPLQAATDGPVAPNTPSGACVEASTVGRYSGNIDGVDRFGS